MSKKNKIEKISIFCLLFPIYLNYIDYNMQYLSLIHI